ncbi:MAG: cold-shock protein, partial [Devosia sp.]|nr:cold-shock protein [Devosia sp.]
MTNRGELIEWNDERGFGFIRPDGGNERLFVHISQIGRIATRPQLGDRVSYVIGRGRDG